MGPDNVSHLSLHKFETDRFAAARLVGKLDTSVPTCPPGPVQESGAFKAITGGDRLTAEAKYQSSFEFQPFIRLLFSANQLPTCRGTNSQAYIDRWLLIPFERRFRNTASDVPRRLLDANLLGEEELSGALSRALHALQNVRARSAFTHTASTRRLSAILRSVTDPIAAWLDDSTVGKPDAVFPQAHLYSAYAEDTLQSGTYPVTEELFAARVKALGPGIRVVISPGHENTRMCTGIALKESRLATHSLMPDGSAIELATRGSQGQDASY